MLTGAKGWCRNSPGSLPNAPQGEGFSDSNLWRMKQFYEVYRGDATLAPLLRELPWTHNLIILGQSKRREEREFYPASP